MKSFKWNLIFIYFLPWATSSLRSNEWGVFRIANSLWRALIGVTWKKHAGVFCRLPLSFSLSHSLLSFCAEAYSRIVVVQYACRFLRAFIAHPQQCIGFLALVDHSWFHCWKEWVVAALKHRLLQKYLSWSNNERETKERLCIRRVFFCVRQKRLRSVPLGENWEPRETSECLISSRTTATCFKIVLIKCSCNKNESRKMGKSRALITWPNLLVNYSQLVKVGNINCQLILIIDGVFQSFFNQKTCLCVLLVT